MVSPDSTIPPMVRVRSCHTELRSWNVVGCVTMASRRHACAHAGYRCCGYWKIEQLYSPVYTAVDFGRRLRGVLYLCVTPPGRAGWQPITYGRPRWLGLPFWATEGPIHGWGCGLGGNSTIDVSLPPSPHTHTTHTPHTHTPHTHHTHTTHTPPCDHRVSPPDATPPLPYIFPSSNVDAPYMCICPCWWAVGVMHKRPRGGAGRAERPSPLPVPPRHPHHRCSPSHSRRIKPHPLRTYANPAGLCLRPLLLLSPNLPSRFPPPPPLPPLPGPPAPPPPLSAHTWQCHGQSQGQAAEPDPVGI